MNRQDRIVQEFLAFVRTQYPSLHAQLQAGAYHAPTFSTSGRHYEPGVRSPGVSGMGLGFENTFSDAWHQFQRGRGPALGLGGAINTQLMTVVREALMPEARAFVPPAVRADRLAAWMAAERAAGRLPSEWTSPATLRAHVQRSYPGQYDAAALEGAIRHVYGQGVVHAAAAPASIQLAGMGMAGMAPARPTAAPAEGPPAGPGTVGARSPLPSAQAQAAGLDLNRAGYRGARVYNRRSGTWGPPTLGENFKESAYGDGPAPRSPTGSTLSDLSWNKYVRQTRLDREEFNRRQRAAGLPEATEPLRFNRRTFAQNVDLGPNRARSSPFIDPGGVIYRGEQLRDHEHRTLLRLVSDRRQPPALRAAVSNYLRGKQIILNGRYVGRYEDVMGDRGNLSGPDLRRFKKPVTGPDGRTHWVDVDERDPESRLVTSKRDPYDRGFGVADALDVPLTLGFHLGGLGQPQWREQFGPTRPGEERSLRSYAPEYTRELRRRMFTTPFYESRRKYTRYPKGSDPDYWASRDAAEVSRDVFGRGDAVEVHPGLRRVVDARFKREVLGLHRLRQSLEFRLRYATGREREEIEFQLNDPKFGLARYSARRREDELKARLKQAGDPQFLAQFEPLPGDRPEVARFKLAQRERYASEDYRRGLEGKLARLGRLRAAGEISDRPEGASDFTARPISAAFRGEFKSAASKVFGRSALDLALDPHAAPVTRVTLFGEEKLQHPYENLRKLLYQARRQLADRGGDFEAGKRAVEAQLGAKALEPQLKNLTRQPFRPEDALRESLKEWRVPEGEIERALEPRSPEEAAEFLDTRSPLIRPAKGTLRDRVAKMKAAQLQKGRIADLEVGGLRDTGSSYDPTDYLLRHESKPGWTTGGSTLEKALAGRGTKLSSREADRYGLSRMTSQAFDPGDAAGVGGGLEEKRSLLEALHSRPEELSQAARKELVADPAYDLASLPDLTKEKSFRGLPLKLEIINQLQTQRQLDWYWEALEKDYGGNTGLLLEAAGPLFAMRRGVLQANKGAGK